MPYIIIAGPTASGKSALALKLAEIHNAIIVNADSMQWYVELPILTAQPTEYDKKVAPHHLYGILDIHENGSVSRWQKEAVSLIQSHTSQLIIVVGGSGLYLRSLTHGMSPVIDIPKILREEVRTLTKDMLIDELRALVLKEDSDFCLKTLPIDRQRLARVLEVKRATGQSIRNFQGNQHPPVSPPMSYIILAPERQLLCQRINQRVIHMIKNNLIDEIKAFWHKKPPNDCLLQKAIGLNPITAYINDEISKESAIELMQIQTRQYAKRQTTWFKGQSPTDTWINPTLEQISMLIKNKGF